ncbi:chemotaxis protein CheY [Anoxybacillus gonensis]|uniref:Response regulator n=1 Tax=Anoxybacillus gonensis TaxID=198467 RepID=A0AAW7TIA0_9BACL|nr:MULTISPECIES: response regulator [Anoxybacillus]AXM87717.1 DNA-binding protein [Anoxybacillus ayderensis G10]THD15751.1 DNA-binding protein [Anoxybacillus ayderensis]AKS38206.1 chemotaxis protein CheY [Anoxybacillus gonensis]KGP59482.1 chemotaxis protein CheY [Anoxybacillus gonensis]MBW9218447.1 response regulator [Anoxybacillus sp. ST70]
MHFFLIEDDAVVRKMLEKIIHESGLGEVVGQAEDGLDVSIDQLYAVDVVLIDLLMPGLDGIQTMKKLRAQGFTGPFIMISQVENKEMIGQAYLHGIDTYIHKPINRYEVVSVLKRVADYLSVASSLDSIRRLLQTLEKTKQPLATHEATTEQKARQLLLVLGIAGEAGAADLLAIMRWLSEQEQQGRSIHDLPPLKELYAQIVRRVYKEEQLVQKEIRAMEQRIRRMVLQAFTHLSSLGLADYTNPTFEHFAPRLFDFEEIRLRMQELEAGEKATKCRINVKKFLTAFYMEIKNM